MLAAPGVENVDANSNNIIITIAVSILGTVRYKLNSITLLTYLGCALDEIFLEKSWL